MTNIVFGKSLEIRRFTGDHDVAMVLRIQEEAALGGTFLVVDAKSSLDALILDIDARKMAHWILDNTEPDEEEGETKT